MLQTLSLQVTGKVQGVYYRQSTKALAASLGITGYVQNQPDRSVHIMATGSPEKLKEFLAWCKKGPEAAEVLEVKVTEEPLSIFDRFYINR